MSPETRTYETLNLPSELANLVYLLTKGDIQKLEARKVARSLLDDLELHTDRPSLGEIQGALQEEHFRYIRLKQDEASRSTAQLVADDMSDAIRELRDEGVPRVLANLEVSGFVRWLLEKPLREAVAKLVKLLKEMAQAKLNRWRLTEEVAFRADMGELGVSEARRNGTPG